MKYVADIKRYLTYFFYVCKVMTAKFETYVSPESRTITLIPEQCVLALSGYGSNEELLEDPDDYIDFFE